MSQHSVNYKLERDLTMGKNPNANPGNKNQDKYTVKVFQWVNGQLKITEQDFVNFNKAKDFANSLGQCDCHIKIYNEFDQIVYDEKRGSANQNDPELYA